MPTDLSLLRHLLPRTTDAGTSLATTVGEAATPAEIMDADLPLARLERAFRTPHLDSVALHGADDDRIGLVTRSRFFASVSGELGFGRALLARGVAADVADWSPLVLDAATGVVEAALAVTSRAEESRYDPVLVRSAEWRIAAPADLIRALTSQLAVRTLQDDVTGLPNLAHVRAAAADRLARAAGTAHRVALVVLRVDPLDVARAEQGGTGADELARRAAAHLRAAALPGWDVGRTGDAEFGVVGTLVGPLGAPDAAAALDRVQTSLAGTLRTPSGPVALRSAAVCSGRGTGRADDLLASARRRLASPVRELASAGV